MKTIVITIKTTASTIETTDSNHNRFYHVHIRTNFWPTCLNENLTGKVGVGEHFVAGTAPYTATTMMIAHCIAVFLLCASLHHAQALKLSNTLGDNMVLQRAPFRNVIWGWDSPHSSIVVDQGK